MYLEAFANFPVIHTERLVLRQHIESDAEAIATYANDPDLRKFYDGFPSPEQVSEVIRAWTGEAYESKTFIRWAIALKGDNRCIGGVYLFLPYGDDTAGRRMDIGVELSPGHRNRGYAAEAIRAVTRYGFETMGLKRVQAQIIPENIASIKAFLKAGFVQEGLLRNFCHYIHNGSCLRDMVMLSCVPGDIGS